MKKEEFYKRLSELDNQLASGAIDRNKYNSSIEKLIDDLSIAARPKDSWVTNEMSLLSQRTPGAINYLNQKRELARQGKLAEGIATGVEFLANSLMAGAAGSQIAQARRAAGQLTPPAIPPVPGRDPYLEQAMSRAALGTIDVNQALNPARVGIQDAYASALNQARAASGGQAGAYQGLSNLANLQRMRANIGLAPIAQQAQVQNASIYNQLLGQRLQETQNIFDNSAAAGWMAQQQYDKDAAAVGLLGQAGGANLANAGLRFSYGLQQASPYLASLFPNLPSKQRTMAQQEAAEFATRRAGIPSVNPPYVPSTPTGNPMLDLFYGY